MSVGKSFVPQFINFVVRLCEYYTKHYEKVLVSLTGVLSGPDLLTVTAGMTALKASCDILLAHRDDF